jgi:hypothetical protein
MLSDHQALIGLLQVISTLALAILTFIVLIQTKMLDDLVRCREESLPAHKRDTIERRVKFFRRIRPYIEFGFFFIFCAITIWQVVLYVKK